ncbi:MAG: Zn-dependent exopeptidase M28 [Planctomycetes bacterium]|nr:Zn-dependent exopeptidase M28 [Planctomycetota bacterium]
MTDIVFDGQRAFRLLQQLSFPRLGGTPDEKRAAELLKKYLRSVGLNPKEETFKVQTYREIFAAVEVLAPYRKRYKVSVVANSSSTPDKGLKGEMVHLISTEPAHIKSARNKIALTYNALTKNSYQQLRKYKTKAVITVTEATPGIRPGKRGDWFIKAYGKLPSVIMGYQDALEMVHKGARTVNVISKQKEFNGTSRNVVATIPGTELPNEKIIICGHYDSVNQCPGTVDNGGGSVSIAEFARYFAANRSKRTLVFIWFGSEELGLKGSWAYAVRHKKELAKPRPPLSLKSEQIKLVINFDVAGTIFGNNGSVVCGSEAMANFVDSFAKEKGIPFSIEHAAYSSDNIPFNEKGIPSIALNRYSGIYGHSTLDDIRLAGAEGLKIMGQFGLELTNRIVNASEIPFDLNIPDADKKFTYEYVERSNPFYKRP